MAKQSREISARQERVAFGVVYLILCMSVLFIPTELPDALQLRADLSLTCVTSKLLLVPFYKPLGIAMWGVLLTVLSFVHWEENRDQPPKRLMERLKIRAGPRPVNRNWIWYFVVCCVAAILAVWFAAAIFVVPVMFGFWPVAIVVLLLVPLVLVAVPMMLVALVRHWIFGYAHQLRVRDVVEVRFHRSSRRFGGYSSTFGEIVADNRDGTYACLLYTSPSPRDQRGSRMPSSA